MAGGAFDAIACAVGVLRVDGVVVGGRGVKAFNANPEDGVRMILIEADVGFRCLGEVAGVGSVTDDAEMLV
jgi:hypothetical protein